MKLSDLTSVAAVQAALDEFSAIGQDPFLKRHGFGKASGYLVRNPRDGTWADSKAIAGVALAYQFPGSGLTFAHAGHVELFQLLSPHAHRAEGVRPGDSRSNHEDSSRER